MALLKKLMDRVDGNSQVAIADNLDRLIREAHSEHQTLEEDRKVVDQLVTLGRTTLGQLEDLKRESATLASLEERLPHFRAEIQPAFDQQAALKDDLDQLRGKIATLVRDAEAGRCAALKARAHATKATG